MLGSITPLGERGRNSRWMVTVTAYVVGSTAAGILTGSVLGAMGGLVAVPWVVRLWTLGLLVGAGVALDAGLAGARLPTVRRQVNEDWLVRYRGWVYGGAFGVQLGLGVVTVVNLSAVYTALGAELLAGSAAAGGLIGGTFGLLRGLPLATTARVRAPAQLRDVDARLRAWDRPARRAVVVVEAGVAMALVASAVVA